MTTIALLGAGGNMGTRVSRTFLTEPDFQVLHVEPSSSHQEKLSERGIESINQTEAVPQADVIIMAIADTLIGPVSQEIVPLMRSGAMLICLDPAAPHAGLLPDRSDITYFVTHPSHPPIFNDETDPAARANHFGSGLAKQCIVNALMQGPEFDYERGETIAKMMWQPVVRSHRVTVEQMAYLEPVLSETVGATCVTIIGEALEEVVKRGVPREAAKDFIMGHLNIEIAIVFKQIDWNFSSGAQKAIEEAKKSIFRDDWKKVFEPDELTRSVKSITNS
jgi:D-apionate oxidoisomerase